MMGAVDRPLQPELADEVVVGLRPIGEDDLDLLRALLGDAAMTRHVAGPESEAKIRARHHRLLRDRQPGATFAITVRDDPKGVGWVGYWETEHGGGVGWEAGVSLLPPRQGQAVAPVRRCGASSTGGRGGGPRPGRSPSPWSGRLPNAAIGSCTRSRPSRR